MEFANRPPKVRLVGGARVVRTLVGTDIEEVLVPLMPMLGSKIDASRSGSRILFP